MIKMERYCYDQKIVELNYKGIDFKVVLRLEEEDIPYDQAFEYMDEKDIKEIKKDIEEGKYLYFCAILNCYWKGIEVSYDSLSCCTYEDIDDFIKTSGYYDDMRDNVLKGGFKYIKNLKEELDKITINE
jgi:hypothetical protein